MSETTNEPDDSSASGGSTDDVEAPETGLISDEQLPDDLNPDKNPLAANPDEKSDDDSPEADSGSVDGMPDMGDPGAAG